MKMDSEQLNKVITGCQAGRNKDFAVLVDIYGRKCYGYFYRLTGDREVSNDLLSELFLKLVEKIGSFRGGSFDTWLFTIAMNLFRDHLRGKYRRQKLMDEKSKLVAREESSLEPAGPDTDALQEALGQLDPETAELISLRYFGELSFKELARMRNEPIGTTLSRVHRGLKRLKELMADKV